MTAVAVLLSLALAVLTGWEERKNTDRGKVLRINRILALAGCAILFLTLVACFFTIRPVLGIPSTLEWKLLCKGYALIVGSVFFIVLVSLLLAALLRLKNPEKDSGLLRFVRVWLSPAASAACLLLSALFVAATGGGHPDLSPVFFSAGLGFALILRVTLLFEYRS
jgi:hypothetical protein